MTEDFTNDEEVALRQAESQIFKGKDLDEIGRKFDIFRKKRLFFFKESDDLFRQRLQEGIEIRPSIRSLNKSLSAISNSLDGLVGGGPLQVESLDIVLQLVAIQRESLDLLRDQNALLKKTIEELAEMAGRYILTAEDLDLINELLANKDLVSISEENFLKNLKGLIQGSFAQGVVPTCSKQQSEIFQKIKDDAMRVAGGSGGTASRSIE